MYLGTANWGYRTEKNEAFAIIDEFLENGFNFIDTAINYPINKRVEDFSLAISWLREWQSYNSNTRLNIYCKIGSINNLGDNKVNLSAIHVNETIDELKTSFGINLHGVGIHWDNRNKDCYSEILETILTLNDKKKSMKIGMSGIKFPSLYAQTKKISNEWIIQVKEFPGYSAGREHYLKYFSQNPFIAYGLSHFMKLNNESNDKKRRELYFTGLEYFLKSDYLQGFIVAPRKVDQAKEILHYLQKN